MSEALVKRGPLPPGSPHAAVAIVGAGACGLTAALMLNDAQIDCVVLERDAQPSGSTALSSGFIPAPGTRVQAVHGVADSPRQFVADIQSKSKGTAAEHLAVAYSEAIGPALDALQDRHGLEWLLLTDFLYPGHSVWRMHAVPEKTGTALMDRLQNAISNAQVPLLTQALVRHLWLDADDVVIGISYQRPDGSIEHLGCQALILACNGFGGNAQMVREWLPEVSQAIFAGHAGNDGSAITWGRTLQARLADLGGYQGHGSWAVPHGVLITWALMMEGGVQINLEGKRFHDETLGYSEAAVQVLAQPGAEVWNVFDEELLKFAREFPDFRQAEAAGAVKPCADEHALAALIGCEDHQLQLTLDSLEPGRVGPYGRVFTRKLQAPFYAIKVTGALFHTQGGLDIDAHCRVLKEDGRPFANLLAAGGAARGVSGNSVWGYLSGNGLLSAVAGGFIAAQTIAAKLGK
ncbi:MAG: FAD-dependent oxidoreductase [Hylemonella sp.]